MFHHTTDYINAINTLRGTTGINPEHNQHIWQIAQCIQDAFAANNHAYDTAIMELRQTVKRQQEEIENLKVTIQTQQKQNPPATPIPADIFITPTSLRKAKKDIIRYLN